MADFTYAGSELDLFRKAIRWKSYYREHISSWVRGDVLEVGAGIGTNTRLFEDCAYASWTCLEPDAALLDRLRHEAGTARNRLLRVATTESLAGANAYDTVMYIDVLEHIEDDRAELARAAGLLRRGGHLIVLAPAHQFLYTPFDAAIGHFRRYDLGTLRAAAPASVEERRLCYLDSAGVLASTANRLLLRQAMPTEAQILFWDRRLVPVSRVVDRALRYRVGKSVLGVWEKRA